MALGRHTEEKKSHFLEGVLYLKEKELDAFFVTLNKSEKDYSQSTMYHDYSIGQRYVNQRGSGGNVLFFVRKYKEESG